MGDEFEKLAANPKTKIFDVRDKSYGDPTATEALAHLCHALFASAEFRYLN